MFPYLHCHLFRLDMKWYELVGLTEGPSLGVSLVIHKVQ